MEQPATDSSTDNSVIVNLAIFSVYRKVVGSVNKAKELESLASEKKANWQNYR